MYATCLEELQPEPSQAILDIGSGCGLFTVMCGVLVGPTGSVLGLDIRDDIVQFARRNLARFCESTGMDLSHVKFEERNVFLPDPEERKFDRIHCAACVPKAHLAELIALLNPGGRLVTPFDDRLIRVDKNIDGTVKQTTLAAVRYSDLIIPSEADIRAARLALARKKATTIIIPPSRIVQDLSRTLAGVVVV